MIFFFGQTKVFIVCCWTSFLTLGGIQKIVLQMYTTFLLCTSTFLCIYIICPVASISITIILKDARAAGCCTSAEAERFIEQKRKKEAEETARGVKESSLAGPSGKFLQRANNLKGELDSSAQGGVTDIDSGGKDSSSTTAGLAISNTLNNWDVTGFVGANLLSEAVRMLLALSMSIT